MPHRVGPGAMHVPPRQQPLGQEIALQTQDPLTQADPAAHAGPLPQRQVPDVASHPLAVRRVQPVHATPPMAQADIVGVMQAPPAQHPYGHELASQTHAPAMQLVPAPQAALLPHRQPPAIEQLSACMPSQVVQAAPVAPQAIRFGGVHVDPEQQPAQLEGLQLLHTPPAHGPSPQS